MVLSSLSPLFILWAIRGNCYIPDVWFIPACLSLVILPTAVLCNRMRIAKKNSEKRQIKIGTSNNKQSDILIYLFAILLPFYREEIATGRDFTAMIIALLAIIFLFLHLNFHYMNIGFAIFRYQIFSINPPEDLNPHTGREPFVLITRRRSLLPGENLDAYRLSDTVFWEKSS